MIKMIRPDWFEFWGKIGGRGFVVCNCGNILQSQQAIREHWQMGHMNYVEKENKEEK